MHCQIHTSALLMDTKLLAFCVLNLEMHWSYAQQHVEGSVLQLEQHVDDALRGSAIPQRWNDALLRSV